MHAVVLGMASSSAHHILEELGMEEADAEAGRFRWSRLSPVHAEAT